MFPRGTSRNHRIRVLIFVIRSVHQQQNHSPPKQSINHGPLFLFVPHDGCVGLHGQWTLFQYNYMMDWFFFQALFFFSCTKIVVRIVRSFWTTSNEYSPVVHEEALDRVG
jgi:hypothetical protein